MTAAFAMIEPRECFIRLGGALAFAGVLGINRDLHHKPAGLRTHGLVALGAALVTLVALQLAGPETGAGGAGDAVIRIIQGVITGVGFLCGGVILHGSTPDNVFGLTTAASIWLAAALGIACGAGLWSTAWLTTGLALAVLVLGGSVERGVHKVLDRMAPRDGGGSGKTG
ncbi:MAG TPA: MgtC/SapB family protein [archaeon]|nr:MgtC/SapB family protein [archaeon]